MARTIQITRHIEAPPEEVYIALTNPFTISLWTNEPAEMEAVPGSEFSMLGGNITGRNLFFEPSKTIQQQWYFDSEEENSVVTISLQPEKSGTQIHVKHTGIPDEAYENMLTGWKENYLDLLQHFFED